MWGTSIVACGRDPFILTGPDIYDKPERRPINPRAFNSQTMSQLMKPDVTVAHYGAMAILSEMKVSYRSRVLFHRYNEYTEKGDLKTWEADILLTDPRYKNGDLEINGESHRSDKAQKNAEKKHQYMVAHGLWFEELENREVSWESIQGVLDRHQRRVDDYGNEY